MGKVFAKNIDYDPAVNNGNWQGRINGCDAALVSNF
jgi:deoxyribodipyrimidine photolyase